MGAWTVGSSDIVRRHEKFFPNQGVHADTSACCMTSLLSDYAFVHQVLSFERVHDLRVTTDCQSLNTYLSCHIADVLEYGEACLGAGERQQVLRRLMNQYYEFPAVSVLKFRGRDFWDYYTERLREIGHPLSHLRLAGAVGKSALCLMIDPARAVRAVMKEIESQQLHTYADRPGPSFQGGGSRVSDGWRRFPPVARAGATVISAHPARLAEG